MRSGRAVLDDRGAYSERRLMWQSLPRLFDVTVTALESGEVVDEYEHFVNDDGELEWDVDGQLREAIQVHRGAAAAGCHRSAHRWARQWPKKPPPTTGAGSPSCSYSSPG
jgi:hypothetical protein